MVIFRENTEDIYAGIEFAAGTRRGEEDPRLPEGELPAAVQEDPLPRLDRPRHQAGLEGRERAPGPRGDRVTRSRNKRKSVTLVHKGNIMKYTEGAFRNYGYALAETRVRRPDLHLGAVGADEGGEGRGGGQRRAEGSSWPRGRS